jgi:hypothetical protein
MSEIIGYKTRGSVLEELSDLHVGEPKVRDAIKELKFEPTICMVDRRARYDSHEDCKHIRQWLLSD